MEQLGPWVPAGTLTAPFNASPNNVLAGHHDEGDGRLDDWMDGDRVYCATEEVVGLGQYGRTLTILSCKDLSLDGELDEPEMMSKPSSKVGLLNFIAGPLDIADLPK